MEKFKCNHKWQVGQSYNARMGVSILKCEKCGIYMTVNEASQMELWRHTVGIQKWLSILAIFVSVTALVISFLK